jgi:endoribonuclease Dicer
MDDGEKMDTSHLLKNLIPYNLQTQHSLPDKSIADCVEALIGCYLTTCGQRSALQFMSWLGLKVLPDRELDLDSAMPNQYKAFSMLPQPPSPLLTHLPNVSQILDLCLDGFEAFEQRIRYAFKDKSYLLQAFTHASYHYNTVTDCYQRSVLN